MTTLVAVSAKCAHEHDYRFCKRCQEHTSTSATHDSCRCPTCTQWGRTYRAEHPKQRHPARTQGTPAPALQFDLTCPYCGDTLRFVTNGRVSSWELVAVMRCATCNCEHIVRTLIMGPNGRYVRSPS